MSDDLAARLRRLGVTRGARPARPRLRPAATAVTDESVPALEALLPGGRLEETDAGACFVVDHVYPLNFRHGSGRLATLLDRPTGVAARMTGDGRLAERPFRDYLFLDTETTGLGGAGTVAFMVGVGFFDHTATDGDVFVVRQYFLRDHGDESAMLHLLSALMAERAGVITFNGRSFDLPLLDSRYIMNRLDDVPSERPHFDLLPPSRRLWRRRLTSCALSSLEKHVLGVRRSGVDVPGWLIPSLYNAYLRSNDATELVRVFYHNEIDMLSMVVLAERVARQYADPSIDDHPADLVSLGRWQAAQGDKVRAEATWQLVLTADPPLPLYHETLHRLGKLLKRDGRREEAVVLWQQMASTSYDDVAAHVELAKHYEWQHGDPSIALTWTERALAMVDSWPSGAARLERPALEHRQQRLLRKVGASPA